MVGSINTNIGAEIALQNLNITGTDLASAQKKISTGLKVSDAFDNGAVFAIAQSLRSDVSAISTVNGQLGAARGLLSVTDSALTAINTSLGTEDRSVVTQLADQNVTGNPRVQLSEQLYSISTSYYNYIQGATYNGSNLLSSGATNKAVIQDISANQFTIQSHDILAQGFVGSRTAFPVPPGGYTPSDATALLNGGVGTHWSSLGLQVAQDFIESALNQVSADTHFIDNQITFNNALSDATTGGLGALVDADLAKESAKLQSLQVKQQLGTQSLGIANQSPQGLLALFR